MYKYYAYTTYVVGYGSYSVCLSTLGACFGFGGSGLYTWVRSSLLDINENHNSLWCNQPHTSTIRSNQYTLEQAPLLSLCLLLPCNYLTVAWLSVCFNLCSTLLQITNCSYQRFYKCTCRTYILVFPIAEFGVGQICSSCRGCPHWWGPEGCPLQALWPVWLVEPGQTPRCLVPRLGRATALGNGRFSVYDYKQQPTVRT